MDKIKWTARKLGGWRYQPVIVRDGGGRYLSVCECYFNDDGTLKMWSEPRQWGAGENIEELTGDLVRMLIDAYKWSPVQYKSLKAGMKFERAIPQEQCEGIAQLCENVSLAAKPRIH